jgi:multidrug efflux pump subunit AcrA (membrane-fusion protein)
VQRGVATAQQVDQLRTAVDVVRGQRAAAEAGRAAVVQQAAEGDVLAPEDGRVLTVPVTRGAVVLAGEPVATIGSGGLFLRLAVPERHAAALREGDAIRIGTRGAAAEGRLA